ncbi:hypothetical protein MUP77_10025, partial [Candidatus Bathyarchaeota archaeon]|nr:hypothetical protein [Candidatus Bathyarchaeota archaeon]
MSDDKEKLIIDLFKDRIYRTQINEPIDFRSILMRMYQHVVDLQGSLEEEAEYKVISAVSTFVSIIPEDHQDDTFKEELKTCYDKIIVDTRDFWCGVKYGDKTPLNQLEKKELNADKTLHAITNLFSRLGWISRKTKKSMIGEEDNIG